MSWKGVQSGRKPPYRTRACVGLWKCVDVCGGVLLGDGLCSELVRINVGGYRMIWKVRWRLSCRESFPSGKGHAGL